MYHAGRGVESSLEYAVRQICRMLGSDWRVAVGSGRGHHQGRSTDYNGKRRPESGYGVHYDVSLFVNGVLSSYVLDDRKDTNLMIKIRIGFARLWRGR